MKQKQIKPFQATDYVRCLGEHNLTAFEQLPDSEKRFAFFFTLGKDIEAGYDKLTVTDHTLQYTRYFVRYYYGNGRFFKKSKIRYSVYVNRLTEETRCTPILDTERDTLCEVLDRIQDFQFAASLPNVILSKGVVKQILLGKITNPEQAVKYYLKSIKHAEYPWRKVLHYKYNTRLSIKLIGEVIVDPVSWLQTCDSYDETWERDSIVEDMVHQALALGRKFNPLWSMKRLQEVHNDWTTEITRKRMEGKVTSEDPIWPQQFVERLKEHGVTLLNTEKEVFEEGCYMQHCIYTNYFRNISFRNYIGLHTEATGSSITIGIRLDDEPYFEQAFHRRNNPLDANEEAQVRWIYTNIRDILKEMKEYHLKKSSIH